MPNCGIIIFFGLKLVHSRFIIFMTYTAQHHADDVSFFPCKDELSHYSFATLKKDAKAAISVALLTLPQAMAYALLAGLPLSSGLFAAIYSSMIAATFGSSKHVVVGPSNAIAILVQSGTADILYSYYRGVEGIEREVASLQILTQLAFLTGLIQVVAAWCKLGRLTQFVSHSVVVGYVSGTAIAMMVNQLFTFFGVASLKADQSIFAKLIYLLTHFTELHGPTFGVGVVSLVSLLFFKKVNRYVPASLAMIILIACGVHFLTDYGTFWFGTMGFGSGGLFDLNMDGVLLVKDSGGIQTIIPTVSFPYFDFGLMNHLLPVSFAIALLSVMETSSVGKTIAANTGQRLSVNQEIFGLGLGNICSSFIAGMPVSGSLSRSSLIFSLGAKTRFAAILNATFVGGFLYYFNFFIMHIPLAALSALLLVTALTIINPRQFFLCLKATNYDAFVLIATLSSCLFFSLDIAFYIGVALSITLYLQKSATPQLVEYEIDPTGELVNLDHARLHEHRTIRIIKVEGELFFGAADIFQTTLKAIAQDDTSTKVIILQLKNARDIDATACLAMQQLYDYLNASGRFLIASGMTQQIWDVLSDSGLVQLIGKRNLFIFDEKHPHLHILKAMKRAHVLLGDPALDKKTPDEEMQGVTEKLTKIEIKLNV